MAGALKAAQSGTGDGKIVTVVGTVNGFTFDGDYEGITIKGSETGKITGSFTAAENASLNGLKIEGLAFEKYGIDFSAKGVQLEGAVIQNCEFDGTGITTKQRAIMINANLAKGLQITGNTIKNYEGTDSTAILVCTRENFTDFAEGYVVTISNNTIDNIAYNAIQATDLEKLVISGNTISNVRKNKGPINLNNTKEIEISGNTITLAEGYAGVYYNINKGIVTLDGNTIKNSAGETLTFDEALANVNNEYDGVKDTGILVLKGATEADDRYIAVSKDVITAAFPQTKVDLVPDTNYTYTVVPGTIVVEKAKAGEPAAEAADPVFGTAMTETQLFTVAENFETPDGYASVVEWKHIDGEGNVTWNTTSPAAGLSLSADGKVTTTAETPAGEYVFRVTNGKAETINDPADSDEPYDQIPNPEFISSGEITLTVAKAAPTITTAPAASAITYGQTLANSTLSGGEASVASTFAWSDSTIAPAVSDSNSTDYDVVFTPEDTTNYNTATCKVKLTVNKAAITPSVSITGWTYGTTANTPSVTGNTGNGTVNYSYKIKDAADETYKAEVPANAGQYTVKAEIAATDNYAAGSATADFTIAKADAAVTAPTANVLTYNGLDQALITEGTSTDGELQYKRGTDGAYSTEIPTAKDAGEYTVYYKVVGDSNHSDTAEASVEVTIAVKEITITPDADQKKTYGDVDPAFTYTNTALCGTDTLSGALSRAEGENYADAGYAFNLGTLAIEPAGNAANYELKLAEDAPVFMIEKKLVTIKVKDKYAYAGTALPEFGEDDFTVTGLINGDKLTVKPSLAYDGTEDMQKEGTYPILASGADAGSNYTISYEPGTLTVIYYVEPTVNVPVSGEENSVNVKATVSNKTATVQSVKEAEIEKVIGDDVETGMVVFDLSGLKQDVTAVKFPTEAMKAIADAAADARNDTAGLKLIFTSGTLEFDARALEAITKAAGTAQNIEIHFDSVGTARLNATQKAAVSEMVVVEGYEAYVSVNGKRVSDFNGGSVTVYIPYEIPAGNNPAGYTVWFIAEDGTMEKQNASYDGTNHRFIVSHFSDYVLTYGEAYGAYNNCPKDNTCPAGRFTDVDVTAWYHDGIHFCVENNIMNGVADTKFDVTGDITRAQIVTMLWRLEGEPAANYAMSFADVAEEQWYTDAVRWAASEDIVNGYGDGKFGTNDPITREQLATILYRYAQSKGQGFTGSWMFLLSFVDRADISSWADEAVHWCSMKNIVNGIGGNVFDPQGTATRAEAAAMMQRFCAALEK